MENQQLSQLLEKVKKIIEEKKLQQNQEQVKESSRIETSEEASEKIRTLIERIKEAKKE